jgi:hypothetical protein
MLIGVAGLVAEESRHDGTDDADLIDDALLVKISEGRHLPWTLQPSVLPILITVN